MCKKRLSLRHLASILALVAISIMVASLFTPVFGGSVPLRLSSGTALAQSSTMPMVAAGDSHSVGLKSDGTVVAVGYNYYGTCNVSSWTGIIQVAAGAYHTVGLKSDGTVVAVGYNNPRQCDVSSWTGIQQVAAGHSHSVGLKSDGTVVAVGDDSYGQCDVSSWTDIRQVAAGEMHTVGLKSDGTVVAVGDDSSGQCDVSSWTGIIQVAAGWVHTVGLKSDGTVVVVGDNFWGQCNVSSWTGIRQVAGGGGHTVGLKSDGSVVAVGWNMYGQRNVSSWNLGVTKVTTQTTTSPSALRQMVAAGADHTVGLKSDGTVVAVGSNTYGQCDVSSWTGIQQVATGWLHTVGLKSDGTVVAVGYNNSGACNVVNWTGIQQVAAGGYHTVGLKSDGTVVAVGSNTYGQCNVSSWTGIQQVAAGEYHTVGLKSDGTVVAVGNNATGQCNVGSWTGIQQVVAGGAHTVGLKSDGTVVAVGYNYYGECDVSSWTGIIQVTAGGYYTVGLKSDGTVVAVGDSSYGQCNVSSWTGIRQVAAGLRHTVGLKSDGTLVAVGDNSWGQCNTFDWNLGVPAVTITLGQGVTDRATITANDYRHYFPALSGTVDFYWKYVSTDWVKYYTASVSGASPVAVTSILDTPGQTGTYYFKAVYSGDSNYSTSTSADEPFQVNPANTRTTTALSATSIRPGKSVTDMATVAIASSGVNFPRLKGTVDFRYLSQGTSTWITYSTVPVNGASPVTVTSTPYTPSTIGLNYFKAVYRGDLNYNGSESEIEILTVFLHQLQVKMSCPADLSIKDPDGLVINKQSSQIPDATYVEQDLDNDGDLDALVTIPYPKEGDYQIIVSPKPGAQPSDTYSLEVSSGDATTVLAQDVAISKIPADGYLVMLTETGTQVAPVAEAGGPYAGDEGSLIPFTSSGSNDPDGTIAQYKWDFGDGSTGTGASPTHAYGDNGKYAVTLTVTDNDGLTSSATTEAAVSNVAPTVEAGTDQKVEVFNPVSCKGNFTDPGWLDTHSATWDWGDGPTSDGTLTEANGTGNVTGSHTYSSVGNYTVTLRVTDKDGVGTDTMKIEVIQKYAIWGNSTNTNAILWSGSGAKITGNVDSNGGVTISGSNNAIVGALYYGSTLTISGSKDTFQSSPQKILPRPMPVRYELSNYQLGAADNEAKRAQNAGKYHLITGNFNVSTSGTVLDGLYYVKGNVALSGSSMKGTFTIVAEGTISISGSGMNCTPYSSGLLFFSSGTSLAISGSNSSLGGIVYVPKGQIAISGSGNKINGSLFGDKVIISGSNMVITAN